MVTFTDAASRSDSCAGRPCMSKCVCESATGAGNGSGTGGGSCCLDRCSDVDLVDLLMARV